MNGVRFEAVAGGAIRLWRGTWTPPLADALSDSTLLVSEGIETGLSVTVSCPELRILCAVSLAHLARMVLPASIGMVIIAADNDGDNPAAAKALQRAVNAFSAQGRQVRIARSPVGSDFNDLLQEELA